MSGRAVLQIVHMDDSFTDVGLGEGGSLTWLPTPAGLMVKHDQRGNRTVYPWATVKSYSVIPDPDPPTLDPDTTTREVPGPEGNPRRTRFVTLCVNDNRKDGVVTVNESRVPVASVLAAIQNRGTVEAAVMFPYVRDDEFAVLTTLVKDLGMRGHLGAPDRATYEQQGGF